MRRSPKRWEDIKAEESRRRVHRPQLESDRQPRSSLFFRRPARTTNTIAAGELSASPLRTAADRPQTVVDLSPEDGMSAVLKAQAGWEQEKALLQGSCDALRASLARERAWRGETEKRLATANEEKAALRDALSAALGAPLSGSGDGDSAPNEVMVPLRQYADLLTLARRYRQTLEDLSTLQRSIRQDLEDGVAPPRDGLFAAFSFEVPPLPHNPLADDLSPSPPTSPAPAALSTTPPRQPALIQATSASPTRDMQSLSPSLPVQDVAQASPWPGDSAVNVGEGVRLKSLSAEGHSTPPRREGTSTPTPLHNGSAPSPPPPPRRPDSARLPICRAILDDCMWAELAQPTTLTGSALKERIGERGSSRKAVAEELEQLNDWQAASSPPPRDPGKEPIWDTTDKRSLSESGCTSASLHLSRLPRIETILPGKLDLEIYSYLDAAGREKRKQRWAIANRSKDTAYTVEYRFANQVAHSGTVAELLSDAHLTQDGRYVLRVAPRERKPFLDGHPGRHTVVVRRDKGEEEDDGGAPAKVSGGAVEAFSEEVDAVESQRATDSSHLVVDSQAPSRRSETMPPQPYNGSLFSTVGGCTTAGPTITGASSAAQPCAHDAADPAIVLFPEAQPGKANTSGHSSGSQMLSNRVVAQRGGITNGGLPPRLASASLSAVSGLPPHHAPDEVIAQTDKLTMKLVKELRALAADFRETNNPTALAALCRKRGLDYVDVDFPPVTASLGNGTAGCRLYSAQQKRTFYVHWCPVAAYTPKNRHADLSSSVGVDPCALRTGMLGDRGVVAALAALAESVGAITNILASTTTEDEASGIFSAWLCDGGEWRLVHVDAYLPCVSEEANFSDAAAVGAQTPYGCVNVMSCDIWGSICEKALAKLLGSYRALKGVTAAAALGFLTGGPVEVWDWWHQNAETAFDEMEAAINTSARGSGVVLITTRTAITTGAVSALRRRSNTASTSEEVRLSFKAAGLLPDTSYRVLAASENVEGEPMLLIRNWQRRSIDEDLAAHGSDYLATQSRHFSPDRGDEPTSADVNLNQAATVVRDSDSCLWLNYRREVLPFFDSCHVCFDCRRYHDVRVPIRFFVEGEAGYSAPSLASSPPAVPSHMLRVTVNHHRRRRSHDGTGLLSGSDNEPPLEPARMWIGLHQPSGAGAVGEPHQQPPHGLKLTLIGHDTAQTRQNRQSTETALRPPAYYTLSESYNGDFQQLPAVWMYVELEAPPADQKSVGAATRLGDSSLPFAHATNVNPIDSTTANSCGGCSSGGSDAATDDADSSLTFYILPQLNSPSTSNRTHFAVPSVEKTAFVAVLAEDKRRFVVELLVAPEEMKAALYHNVLERLDFSGCEAVGSHSAQRKSKGSASAKHALSRSPAAAGSKEKSGGVWCQVNAQWQEGFVW